jgi:hypothetical protein
MRRDFSSGRTKAKGNSRSSRDESKQSTLILYDDDDNELLRKEEQIKSGNKD